MQDLSSMATYLATICNNCDSLAQHFTETFGGLISGNTASSATYIPGDIIYVYRNGDYKTINVDYTQTGNLFTFVIPFGSSAGSTVDGERVTFEIIRP